MKILIIDILLVAKNKFQISNHNQMHSRVFQQIVLQMKYDK